MQGEQRFAWLTIFSFFFCIYCYGNVGFYSSGANCMIFFFFLVPGFLLIKSMMHPAGADFLARLVAEFTLVARMGVAEHSHC